jgi:hypothetical protein
MLILLVALFFSLANASIANAIGPIPPDPVPTQTFTIVNENGVSAQAIRVEEQAIVEQSTVIREHWHTPLVRFGVGGWKIYLVRYGSQLGQYIPVGAAGVHLVTPGKFVCSQLSLSCWTGATPFAIIGYPGRGWMPGTVDHEIIEMLVDPYADRYINGHLVEPCDPVEVNGYGSANVDLSDFVYPRYYTSGSSGPWDYLDILKRIP